MELGLPAVPALGEGLRLRTDARCLEAAGGAAGGGADDRFDDRARPSPGRRGKGGTRKEGFGRSKGGFTTKIHLRTCAEGLPLAAEITGGEVSDYKGYDRVMAAEAPGPRVLLADKGSDSDAVRADIEDSGRARHPDAQEPQIPHRRGGLIYALCNRIES